MVSMQSSVIPGRNVLEKNYEGLVAKYADGYLGFLLPTGTFFVVLLLSIVIM
jgi:pyridoxine/pyridoxamine 5'-phosphate oxidase